MPQFLLFETIVMWLLSILFIALFPHIVDDNHDIDHSERMALILHSYCVWGTREMEGGRVMVGGGGGCVSWVYRQLCGLPSSLLMVKYLWMEPSFFYDKIKFIHGGLSCHEPQAPPPCDLSGSDEFPSSVLLDHHWSLSYRKFSSRWFPWDLLQAT